jgi:hypothetical protein
LVILTDQDEGEQRIKALQAQKSARASRFSPFYDSNANQIINSLN